MIKTIIPMTLLAVTAFASVPDASSPVVGLITPDIVNQHIGKGSSPASDPNVYKRGNNVVIHFGNHCRIKVSRGGLLLTADIIERDRDAIKANAAQISAILESSRSSMTEEDFEKAKQGFALFGVIMGGDDETRYPNIGARALHIGAWDGETTTFTTSDEKYDIEISRIFVAGAFVNTRTLAQDISESYDKLIEGSHRDRTSPRGEALPHHRTYGSHIRRFGCSGLVIPVGEAGLSDVQTRTWGGRS